MTFAVQRKNHVLWVRGAAGWGQGGQGRPHVQNNLHSQVTRPTSRRAEAASVNHACSAPLPQVQIETGSTWTWPYQDLHQNRSFSHSHKEILKEVKAMVPRDECTHTCLQKTGSHFDTNKPPTGFLKDPGNLLQFSLISKAAMYMRCFYRPKEMVFRIQFLWERCNLIFNPEAHG